MGNRNLRPAGIDISLTADQLREYLKCKKDPIYFIEKYVKIVNVDRGLILFPLYPFQKDIVRSLLNNRRVIAKLPRQSGKTTTTAAFCIHQAIFKDTYSILIAANKAATAFEIMKRIREIYQYIPKWLQVGVSKWNGGTVEFENGSRIMGTATTGDAARGYSHNMIILDEFAFLPRGIADNFFTSVIPTISSGETTKIAILSTPKGMNHFYKLWTDAVKQRDKINAGEVPKTDSDYDAIEIKWNDVPGRDESFKERMIRTWGGDVQKWQQEFETDFIGSSDTLISPAHIKEFVWKDQPLGKTEDGLFIYEQAKPGHTYFMTVDTAEGKQLDNHAFVVMDITEKPFRVVARWKNNTLPVLLVPNLIYQVGIMYNEAFVLIETRSLGAGVAYNLFNDLEYPNILAAEARGRSGLVLSTYSKRSQGISTTSTSKTIGCNRLKVLVESHQIELVDYDIVLELQNFVLQGNQYAADEGYHDDLVMCLVHFAWATQTEFFKELSNVDIRASFNEKLREMQEDVTPFGYVLDSDEDHMPNGAMFF